MGRRAEAQILKDNSNEIIAVHYGYQNESVKHVRKWFFNDQKLLIEDVLNGNPENAKAYFHFHPDVEVKLKNNNQIRANALIFEFEGSQEIVLQEYEYCLGFNKTIPAQKVEVSFRNKLISTITE